MEQYLRVKEVSKRMGISERRITSMCKDGKIEGAFKEGKFWYIPKNASCLGYKKVTEHTTYNQYPMHPSLDQSMMVKEPGAKLRLSIGESSYIRVSVSAYYVDKTMMIKDLIDEGTGVRLFTRPRRFGKTLNMNMLKTYFEKSPYDTSLFFKEKKIKLIGIHKYFSFFSCSLLNAEHFFSCSLLTTNIS